jgi:hypothetical protein
MDMDIHAKATLAHDKGGDDDYDTLYKNVRELLANL